MTKIIVLEGVDKAGKSTVAEILSKQTGYPIIKGLPAKTPQELMEMGHKLIDDILVTLERNEGVIVDRMHMFSESIYNTTLGQPGFEESTAEYDKALDSLQLRMKAIATAERECSLFIFTADADIILDRMKGDGGPADELEVQVQNNVKRYINMYEDLYTSILSGQLTLIQSTFKNVSLVMSVGNPEKLATKIKQVVDGTVQERTNPLLFAPIVPKKYKLQTPFALVLAQNLMGDQEQINYWKNFQGYKVLDNGAFELGESVGFDAIIELAHKIKANEIVLPDVFRNAEKTIHSTNAAVNIMKVYRNAGTLTNLKVMAVPQGNTFEEWMRCYNEFVKNPDIEVIAINRDSGRFFGSRSVLLEYLQMNGHISKNKEYHLLGMQDAAQEIFDVAEQYPWVRSIDSCFPYLIAKELVKTPEDDGYYLMSTCKRSDIKGTIDFNEEFSPEVMTQLDKVRGIIKYWGVIV